ncbi:hypothetical protein LZ519_11390 [Sphingomonas sp. RG327]|uniref:Secreted protein n=1 Tax=Sphingomonas anseongensis TaxID=2908207 RepID=A0ABT0RI22_9SPHN|nr:hypothetical protein [Sphingomonas anseongensis]MCL6679912.1 hypothetical protein [Sphingomonas anseongensis]
MPHRTGLTEHRAGSTAQRVRVGMTGLAIAFLLVLLASIASRSGSQDGAATVGNEITNAPKEPLAELGVAPGSDESQANQENAAGKE